MDYFSSKAASRIVGVSLRQIQYWDEQGFLRPSIRASGKGSRRLYSYSDLVRLKVVKQLTDHGLSLQKIRRCLRHLQQAMPDKIHPSGSLRYLTDGRSLFVLTDDRQRILDALNRQFVLTLGLGDLVRELDGEVRRISARRGPARARAETGVHRADRNRGSA
jgi:DNA-binding transcriptional MerR regulator